MHQTYLLEESKENTLQNSNLSKAGIVRVSEPNVIHTWSQHFSASTPWASKCPIQAVASAYVKP
jgi:hypothetical protein